MGLFWQIVVFLIVAAALGFVIGWVLRGSRAPGEDAPRHAGPDAALRDERDRLRTELQAARDAQAEAEKQVAELRQLADARAARVQELEQIEERNRERIAALEQELGEARSAVAQGGEAGQTTNRPGETAVVAAAPVEVARGTPPPGLPAPEGQPDDLQKISGIGPGIEKTLHGLGIWHFRQIAAFTPDNIAWLDQRLRFRGRIAREDWVGQARRLAAGEALDQP